MHQHQEDQGSPLPPASWAGTGTQLQPLQPLPPSSQHLMPFCLNLLISPPCCSNLIASLLFNSENCFRKSLYVKTRSYVPFCSASCFPAQNLLLLPRREHRGAAPTPQRAGQQRAYRALPCWAPEKASFKAFVSI